MKKKKKGKKRRRKKDQAPVQQNTHITYNYVVGSAIRFLAQCNLHNPMATNYGAEYWVKSLPASPSWAYRLTYIPLIPHSAVTGEAGPNCRSQGSPNNPDATGLAPVGPSAAWLALSLPPTPQKRHLPPE